MYPIKPVFLFAFANDDTHSLQLDEEWRQVEKVLQDDEDSGKLVLNIAPSVTLEDVFDKFNRFHNQIAIFHYGGHSDGNSLNLTDSPINNKSLATIIGKEENLQLVFLNGCSNAQQVDVLFEKGVPVVIATSLPISDKRAINFSKQFYSALTAGRSIQSAFDVAAAYINNGKKEIPVIHRSLAPRKSTEKFEWGLYINNRKALDWKIPTTLTSQAPKSNPSETRTTSKWKQWLVSIVVLIGVLVGVAEFMGFSLLGMFSAAPVETSFGFSVSVLDSEENAIIKNGNVFFELNGDTIKTQISKDGLATFKDIPIENKDKKIHIRLDAEGYELMTKFKKKEYQLGAGTIDLIVKSIARSIEKPVVKPVVKPIVKPVVEPGTDIKPIIDNKPKEAPQIETKKCTCNIGKPFTTIQFDDAIRGEQIEVTSDSKGYVTYTISKKLMGKYVTVMYSEPKKGITGDVSESYYLPLGGCIKKI